MLFGGRKVRVSVQVLVVACAGHLAFHYTAYFQSYIKDRLTSFLELLKHTDPLLRGQVYLFVGSIITGYLNTRSTLKVEEKWDLDVFNLLWTLLFSVMKDDSAISAKMACEALAMTVEPVLSSEFAFFVPAMIQHLLCLPRDSYLLLKSKVLGLLAKCDFRTVQYLPKKACVFASLRR